MQRLYNGAERPNRCVYCYIFMPDALGWLYTRHYRQRVRSLTLLGVGVYPGIDWQAHYYRDTPSNPCFSSS